jgi:hypothetical protein
MNRILYKIVPFVICFSILVSCKKKHIVAKNDNPAGGTYFSIVQFALDQWNNFRGEPFTLYKVTKENGKIDSIIVSADTLDWGTDVFKVFFPSDISDRRFLGHYRFSSFDDNVTASHIYYYEAIDDTLFTKKLQISVDPENNKILSIYIETQRDSGPKGVMQRLFYKPLKLIQIQEFGGTTIGAKMEKETEYFFMR